MDKTAEKKASYKTGCRMCDGKKLSDCVHQYVKPTHTPTPWQVTEDVDNGMQRWHEIIGDKNEVMVARCEFRRENLENALEQLANAEFIVRAVNSYDAMRAALRPFAALLSAHHADMPDNRPVFGINDALFTVGDLHAARAALALADQETQP